MLWLCFSIPNSEKISVICSSYNLNKFKGRKISNQNVKKTWLVSNAESIAEIYLLFASKAFILRPELSPSYLVELCFFWGFFVVNGKSLFPISFVEIFFIFYFFWKLFTSTLIRSLLGFCKLFITLLVKYLLSKYYNWINIVYTACSTVNYLCNIYHVASASKIFAW